MSLIAPRSNVEIAERSTTMNHLFFVRYLAVEQRRMVAWGGRTRASASVRLTPGRAFHDKYQPSTIWSPVSYHFVRSSAVGVAASDFQFQISRPTVTPVERFVIPFWDFLHSGISYPFPGSTTIYHQDEVRLLGDSRCIADRYQKTQSPKCKCTFCETSLSR